MSYFGYGSNRADQPEHEKVWKRGLATAWDAAWHGLGDAARLAYLEHLKPTVRPGAVQGHSPTGSFPPGTVAELVAARLARVEPAFGKRSERIFAASGTYDFSARIRAAGRFHLLAATEVATLAEFVRYAYANNALKTISQVLDAAKFREYFNFETMLSDFVVSRRWPEWAADASKNKVAPRVVDALLKAGGPVPLADLPGRIKGAKPDDVRAAVDALVARLAVFEDVAAATGDLMVGLYPPVLEALDRASRSGSKRPALVVVESPKEVSPPGGLAINDLRVFLLEVASQAPRVRQDGAIFATDEDRFFEAMPAWPNWTLSLLKTSAAARLSSALLLARSLKLTEVEAEDKARYLRLAGKGRNWLAADIEDQYRQVFEQIRQYTKGRTLYDHDAGYGMESTYGDNRFLGVTLSVQVADKKAKPTYYSSYTDVKPEQREATRAALHQALVKLPVGVFHRWDSVLDHFTLGPTNVLLQGHKPEQVDIVVGQRPIPRLPERIEAAARDVLEALVIRRLLPNDAVQAAVDADGKLCIARLPRLDGYFGKPYRDDRPAAATASRVVVQPDFSVVVIGLNPAPAAAIAPFADRAGGQAGQGVMTFKISRTSVIRAAGQGLTASAIVARLKKHASVEPPANVLREIAEWADSVRPINVRALTVVRCPDAEAANRVLSALGTRKVERLTPYLLALQIPKLTPADRLKLQDHGIIITQADIPAPTIAPESKTVPTPATPAPKKRGRPRKT